MKSQVTFILIKQRIGRSKLFFTFDKSSTMLQSDHPKANIKFNDKHRERERERTDIEREVEAET